VRRNEVLVVSTTSRVLPWRRSHAVVSGDLAPLLAAFRARHPKRSVGVIQDAYELARAAHREQSRLSGEGYINHPIAVARIVADIGLDEVSIAAALLHDAVEDTEVTLGDVESRFGAEIASLVDGLTKLERIQFDSREAQQAATMRKMLVAIAKDLRVLVIKLADRLHNMRTVASAPVEKQRRVAQETLDIYAPLAHRLGMQEIRQQLEDLSFAALHPKRYAELDHLVATRAPERDVYLAKALGQVNAWLTELEISSELTARGKHLWSLYEKMVQKGRDFDEIFDLMAIRIVVESVRDCYAALGCIHGHWTPVVGRFKDYIATPKFNHYQSLHTTVIGPEGKAIEVQIRSREMHQRAEWGVASHWAYKDGEGTPDIDWLNRLVDSRDDVVDPRDYMRGLKTDLEQDELFVFTPKGKLLGLPAGSTPVDFAYEVHTEIGHTCVGARVNGRLVPLDHRLASGDSCEILTSSGEAVGPSEDWLEFAVLPKARSKIKQWLGRERAEDMAGAGRSELEQALAGHGLQIAGVVESGAMAAELESMNYADEAALCRAIADGHVAAPPLAARLARREGAPEPRAASDLGLIVEQVRDANVSLARCCSPALGDAIVGILGESEAVTIHRADCRYAVASMSRGVSRLVEVEWDDAADTSTYTTEVEVVAFDRSRLLRDVANALSEQHVNIVACTTRTGDDRVARMRFSFELADASHLDSVLRTIRRISSVYDAYRVDDDESARA